MCVGGEQSTGMLFDFRIDATNPWAERNHGG